MSAEDYCDLCDLPRSQCVHGRPPPPPPVAAKAAPRATPVVRKKAASTPARSVPRKWTPPTAFVDEIVDALRAAGGELFQEQLFAELESRMGERFTQADHQRTPEGELRWRYAARRARQALVTEGRMTTGRPGVWALSDTAV